MDDEELARALAEAAGRVLLRTRTVDVPEKELRAIGDRRSHQTLVDGLAAARPGDVVLSEEGADPAARHAARRVWIVDPLDGTREFAERDRDDWAVHVALWVDGELAVGAVCLPALGITYGTDAPPAVPDRPTDAEGRPAPIRLAVSRSRPPALATALVANLGAVECPMGSAGAKSAAVWRGVVDAYVHAGGQYEWDSAAPVAVARAAGLHTSRIDGSPLRYNQPDAWLPDLVICRKDLADEVLDECARLAESHGTRTE